MAFEAFIRIAKPRCGKAGSVNRRDLVLAILAAADGRAYTPVQIQKAVFIVCDQFPDLIEEGPHFHFEPYDYGPFDSDVSSPGPVYGNW
jgi:hypothetical protein